MVSDQFLQTGRYTPSKSTAQEAGWVPQAAWKLQRKILSCKGVELRFLCRPTRTVLTTRSELLFFTQGVGMIGIQKRNIRTEKQCSSSASLVCKVTEENLKSFYPYPTRARCTSWRPCWRELLLMITSAKCAFQMRWSCGSIELCIGIVIRLGETKIYLPSVTWRKWQSERMVRLNAPNGGDRALIFSERRVTEAS